MITFFPSLYAPQRKTPLSLWNPVDYLLLLGWTFYFPQALVWYVDTFGILPAKTNGWQAVRKDPIQRRLAVQGLLLTLVLSVGLEILLRWLDNQGQLCMLPNRGPTMAAIEFGTPLGLLAGTVIGVVKGVASGVAGGVAGSFAGSVMGSTILPNAALGMAVTLAVAVSTAGRVMGRAVASIWVGVSIGLGLLLDTISRLTGETSFVFTPPLGFAGTVTGLVMILRPDAVLLALVAQSAPQRMAATQRWYNGIDTGTHVLIPGSPGRTLAVQRVSPVPMPGLRRHLAQQLAQDWQHGLEECEGLLLYSMQFVPVASAIQDELTQIPDQDLISRISYWCSLPLHDWDVLYAQSAGVSVAILNKLQHALFVAIPRAQRPQITSRLQYDTPVRAACAGFWHLHRAEIPGAITAFAVVRDLPHGEELYANAQALAKAEHCTTLEDVVGWQPPPLPPDELLRPAVREALMLLAHVTRDTEIVVQSPSIRQRSTALNRAIGSLNDFPTRIVACPKPECPLLKRIAEHWLKILASSASAVGTLEVRQPVTSPYIVGAIVPAHRLAGRDKIFDQIRGMWVRPGQRDSVLIYGHRRMGKSSIARSLKEKCDFGADTNLVVLNLQSVDWGQGHNNLCYILAYELWNVQSTTLAEPQPQDYEQHPLAALRQLLTALRRQHPGQRYILILDEYEMLDQRLLDVQAAEFVTALRGFTQDFPWLAVALVGLHTLQERSASFYQAIYAWRPIRVGLLDRAGVIDALQVEDDEFSLEYSPEAIDLIYQITGGQPFLVQLLGDSLVQGFNGRLQVQLNPPATVFTAEDIEAVITEAQFYENGAAYFHGIWEQAGEMPGQRAILWLLAIANQPIYESNLEEISKLPSAILYPALQALKDHDVVVCEDGSCRYTVDLMRRWVRAATDPNLAEIRHLKH